MTMQFKTRVDWRDGPVKSRVRAGSQRAAEIAAKAVLTEANKTVPYETGKLKSTGKVAPARVHNGTGGSATVSYNTPYAARLHENPQYNFKGKGRGKWLQLAIQEMAGRIAGLMAIQLRRELGAK